MPLCPLCYSYYQERPPVRLRWRVAIAIFSAWDHILRGICCCLCCPINCCECCIQGCSATCNALSRRWDDWYYRPPTARKFYAQQNGSRKRRLRIGNDREIAMSDLLELDEPQEPTGHQQEASSFQQEPQTIVCYLFLFYSNFD